jgi:glycosyltransferase involved in cell wall biosynthesis
MSCSVISDPRKVKILMLAYNAESTLARTFEEIPDVLKGSVIVGDDCSTDRTSEVAKDLGLTVIRHERNVNYGGNLKRLFRHVLATDAQVAIELHADHQYDPSLTDLMAEYVAREYFDLLQGNRIRTREEALAGGMPLYRYLGNRVLTLAQNLWFGTVFGEWHSGLRAYSRNLLENCPFDSFSDTHSFASDILVHAVANGFRVGEVPCPVRYEKDSSSVPVGNLFDYAFKTLYAMGKYPPGKRRPLRPLHPASRPELVGHGASEG